ncbi:MarR family winged helix-turn-helix transcriptional regulator [Thermoactinospora rubra]|uniref:MarR family winged helix-turn-helix transcriptional regulator n=1 Tax=Thermoactinospora rubra TaxID=1088767 RepID=UPI000A1201BD|nr:MarR family transcriptional regulator [Thermoactinospora rubra]
MNETTITDPTPADVAAVEKAAAALVAVWARSRQAAGRVSTTQLQALITIESHQPVNLSGLADHLGAAPSSASRLCDRLEAAGLVRRSLGETDRRELTLSLTATGRALLADLAERRHAHLKAVLERMTPAGRSALQRGLREFAAAAEADGPEDWVPLAARLFA